MTKGVSWPVFEPEEDDGPPPPEARGLRVAANWTGLETLIPQRQDFSSPVALPTPNLTVKPTQLNQDLEEPISPTNSHVAWMGS